MKYEHKNLLLEKKSLEYRWLNKKKMDEVELVTSVEEDFNFNLEEVGDFTTEDSLAKVKELAVDDKLFLRKKSLEYLLAVKLNVIEQTEEPVYLELLKKKKNTEKEEYKKWGELQFDGKGVELDDVEKRMVGFSKENIRKVKVE